MSVRRRLIQLAGLQRLGRMERDSAAFDHGEAVAAADAAHRDATDAAARAVSIAARWYAGRAAGYFSPDLDAAIAAGLIDAEDDAVATQDAAARADTAQERCVTAWRSSDARDRAMGRIVRNTRRAAQRAADEAQIDAAAARTLDRWRRP